MKKTLIAVGLAGAFLLAGCGQEKPQAQESRQPTPSPSAEVRVVGKTYFLTSELAADIQAKTSLTCTGYEEIPNPIGAIARASCTEDTGIGVYASKEDAKASAEEHGELIAGMLGDKSVSVIGQNWSVNCGSDEALAQEIAKAMGGEVLITQPQ